MPRILILSASVGAGHLRAAQAIELALRQAYPDVLVQNVDVLELANAPFRRMYGKTYLDLVNAAPHALGFLYDLLDQPARTRHRVGDRLRLLVEKLNLRPFARLLDAQPWDLVINTHFLPAEIIAGMKRNNDFAAPHVTVTTDFDTHRLWVNQPCERYFTATEEGAHNLAAWGIPAQTIRATGIPIHPVFAQPRTREDCCRRQSLCGDRPIVLQLAGGFGVGPIEKIYRALLEIDRPLELVVVTGRNATACQQLQAVPCPDRHRNHVLGFTDRIDELLGAADLVVTKPGGLTTSETLARGAAMCIVNPIPGQESRNSDFLLENGAAIKVNSLATLRYKIAHLLDDPPRLAQLKSNAQALGRPRAAFDIIEHSMALVSRPQPALINELSGPAHATPPAAQTPRRRRSG